MWFRLYGARIVLFHIINGPDAQNLMGFLHLLIFIAVMEKGEKKMLMRDYEDMKDIVIPKEQEEIQKHEVDTNKV